MVDHAQPILDRVGGASAHAARQTPKSLERIFGWALQEALLFPVVALFAIALLGNLPRELFQDGWLVILGGREIVAHGLPSHDTLAIWTHGRVWVDQDRKSTRLNSSH